MKRRHLLLALLLLPCLLARSVLPIGFMWANESGSARIVFCPGQMPSASPHGSTHAEHAHMHHQDGGAHHGTHDDGTGAHGGSQCPFAVAAVTAPPAFIATVVTTVIVVSESAVAPSASSIETAPQRAHLIRGPPASLS